MNTRIASLALLSLLTLAQPARAGLFDDEEARRRIETTRQETDARIKKIESALETLSRGQLTLNNQQEAIKQEQAQSRGQIELLTNDQDQAQKRQKDFYIDLDNRLRKIEELVTQMTKQAQVEPAPDPAQETKDYEAAISALRANKHVDAALALKQFIKTWPKSAFQPGAHFWLAVALGQAKDPEGARDYYARLASIWPDDALAPDALLGQATAEQEMGDAKTARATLEKILAKYPASEAAKSAKQKLASPAKKKK